MAFIQILLSSIVALAGQTASMPVEFYRNHAEQVAKQKLHQQDSTEISVIDEGAASQLFASFKQDRSIPWGFQADGCYARAMAMVRVAERQGVIMGKIFAVGTKPHPLAHDWIYHVAPVAYVGAAGNLVVFDPALFAGPVPSETWLSALNPNWRADAAQKNFTWGRGSRFQYKPHGYINNTYKKSDLNDTEETFEKER